MQAYLNLMRQIRDHGAVRTDRTGTGTKSIFGTQLHFDLREGFPIVTTKKVHFKSVVHELLWFLSGDTNVKYLQDNDVTIWDAWATEAQCARFNRPAGELGPVYGHQWRNFGATLADALIYDEHSTIDDTRDWGDRNAYLSTYKFNDDGFDQISWVINEIRNNPDSRRLIVSGWNPKEANQVALPPCHTLFQFYVQDGALSCHLFQRSSDYLLGVPFNIASYALLTHMIAHVCGLTVGEFIWTSSDTHLYSNHVEQVETQLAREPLELPTLKINTDTTDIFAIRYEDIQLVGYEHHAAIKAPVAV